MRRRPRAPGSAWSGTRGRDPTAPGHPRSDPQPRSPGRAASRPAGPASRRWKLRLRKGQSHAPQGPGDGRARPPAPNGGADDPRLRGRPRASLSRSLLPRPQDCVRGLLHKTDRETEADPEGGGQSFALCVGTGGVHPRTPSTRGRLSSAQWDLGTRESRRHWGSGARRRQDAQAPPRDRAPAVRNRGHFFPHSRAGCGRAAGRRGSPGTPR